MSGATENGSAPNKPLAAHNRNNTFPNLQQQDSSPPSPGAPGSGRRIISVGRKQNVGQRLTQAMTPTRTTKKGVTITAVEDDGDPVPLPSDHQDDIIPGPPAGVPMNVKTERSTSRSRGGSLIHRVLHPGQASNNSQSNSSSSFIPRATASFDELQLSNTEHQWAGAGILANRQDLEMPAEQFAAGCNLLQYAARGDVAAMRALLSAPLSASQQQQQPQQQQQTPKTNVDFRDYDRRTALHVAASEGHLHICKFLIEEYQARINRSDRWGGSPLDDAHRHRHNQVAQYLRSKGASTGSGNRFVNFIKAAADGDLDEVLVILQDAKVEGMMASIQEGESEHMALPSQQQQKSPHAPQFDINKGDYDQRTALHLAAGEGNVEIVKALCEAGANVNVKDRWSRTPLDDAMAGQHEACIEILKQAGAVVGTGSVTEQPQLDNSIRRQNDNMQVQFEELEMIDRIGSGAFGEIYKCRWRGTLVAAKIIKTAKIRKDWVNKRMMAAIKEGKDVDEAIREVDNAEMDQDEKDIALADFRQEISVLKGLRHPNIVLLLAYSTTENYECLISELMKCSLLDIFKSQIIQGTKLRLRPAIAYAKQLSQGMTYLHSCRPPIIHRDLKPANLLVDHSGVLKISDFGLSKVRPDPEKKEKDTFTMTGETGSYRFMAPEVFLHKDYNETVDVYSYAMILFYLLVGRPPWPQLPGMEAVKRAAEEGDRPTTPREVDARLQDLMKECWDENPSLRPNFTTITKVLNAFSKAVFDEDEDNVYVAQDEFECQCDDYCVVS